MHRHALIALSTSALALALTLAGSPTEASAQPSASPAPRPAQDAPPGSFPKSTPPNPRTGLPGEVLERLTFNQAHAKARQSHRLLMVYTNGGGGAGRDRNALDVHAMFERSLGSQVLHAYITWHCVAIASEDLPDWAKRQIEAYFKRNVATISAKYPVVAVFRDREAVAVIPTWKNCLMQNAEDDFLLGIISAANHEASTGGKPTSNFKRPDFPPTPLDVVLRTDIALDALRSRDPIWAALHDRDNPPPPPPPEPGPLCFEDSITCPRVPDPAPDDTELRTSIDRLAHARALLASGDLHKATGYFCWLWERAEAVDPSFRAAKLAIVPQELLNLTHKRPGAKPLVQELQVRRALQHPWADFDRWADMYAIDSAADDPVATLADMNRAINSRDDSAALPRADSAVYFALAQRDNFADPFDLCDRPLAYLSRLADLPQRLPRTIEPENRQLVESFALDHVRNEACRLYAALLTKGRESDALEVAQFLLARQDTPLARASLVTTALAFSPMQPREHQLAWAQAAAVHDQSLSHVLESLKNALSGRHAEPPGTSEKPRALPAR